MWRRIISFSTLLVLGMFFMTGASQAATTKIGPLHVYDYTWNKSGYALLGKVRSPSADCRKVKRKVILRNLTQGKNLGRGVSEPLSQGQFYVSTRPVKGLVRKGDRVRIKVQRRKAGKVTCAAATRVVRVARIEQGGAG